MKIHWKQTQTQSKCITKVNYKCSSQLLGVHFMKSVIQLILAEMSIRNE